MLVSRRPHGTLVPKPRAPQLPPPDSFNPDRWCTLSCHNFRKFSCGSKTGDFIYYFCCVICRKNISSNVLPTKHVILPVLIQPYKLDVCIIRPVTLRWRLVLNGPTPPPTLLLFFLLGLREWSSLKILTVPTGLPIPRSIPSGCCSAAFCLSTRTGPNTYLSVSTPLASI